MFLSVSKQHSKEIARVNMRGFFSPSLLPLLQRLNSEENTGCDGFRSLCVISSRNLPNKMCTFQEFLPLTMMSSSRSS